MRSEGMGQDRSIWVKVVRPNRHDTSNMKHKSEDVNTHAQQCRQHINYIRCPHEQLVVFKAQGIWHQFVASQDDKYSQHEADRSDKCMDRRNSIITCQKLGWDPWEDMGYIRIDHKTKNNNGIYDGRSSLDP